MAAPIEIISERPAIVHAAGRTGPVAAAGGAAAVVLDLAGPHAGFVRKHLAELRGRAEPPGALVLLSAAGADGDDPLPYPRVVGDREKTARSLFPDAVALRTAPIVQDVHPYAAMIRSRTPVPHRYGLGAVPWVDARDVLEVARAAVAGLLSGDRRRAGAGYDVTGEHPVTAADLLSAAAESAGLTVTLQELTAHVFLEGLRTAGMDEEKATGVLALQQWASTPFPASPTVRHALGRPARHWGEAAADLMNDGAGTAAHVPAGTGERSR